MATENRLAIRVTFTGDEIADIPADDYAAELAEEIRAHYPGRLVTVDCGTVSRVYVEDDSDGSIAEDVEQIAEDVFQEMCEESA